MPFLTQRPRAAAVLGCCLAVATLWAGTATVAHADPKADRTDKSSRSQRGSAPQSASGQLPGVAFAHPLGSRPITASYGERGSWWFGGVHDGIDYDANTGDPVTSACTGQVAFAGDSGNWAGKKVVVRCANGVKLTFAHLSRVNVAKGDVLTLSTKVGAVGSSGSSTGSHLHVGAELNGRSVNPSKYIPR